jgi:glycosyltransferase involved in cell wall biosynthesis
VGNTVKKAKINILFPVNFLGVGGAEQQLLELVKGIDKSRFNPFVVTLYPGGQLYEEIQQMPDVEIMSVNRKGKLDFLILIKMLSILRQNKIDIIQPFSTPAALFGLLAALVNRTPVKIMTERGGFRSDNTLGFQFYQKTQDFFTRFADLVVANSEAGRDYLISRGINPACIKVVYNGLNTKRLVPDPKKVEQIRDQMKLPENGTVIGMVASFFPDKDYPMFIKGAKIIHQTMPQTRFAFLGDGPLRRDMENLARESGLEPFVTFFGSQRDIASYISCFDISCLCADDSEGCSNVILESMALGKPVVATDGGGNRELVKNTNTGLLVPMQDVQAFANAVLKYLRQPDQARETAQRAQKMVFERFSLTRMVHDYEQLYEHILQIKGRGRLSTG